MYSYGCMRFINYMVCYVSDDLFFYKENYLEINILKYFI